MFKKIAGIGVGAIMSAGLIAGAQAQEAQAPPLMGLYSFGTQDAGAVVGAFDDMMEACGDTIPATVSILGEVFNGSDPTTHTVIFTYANADDMATTAETFQSCEGAEAFYATANAVITPYSNSLGQGLIGGGDALADQAFMVFQLSVSDEAAYGAAFAELMESSDLPGSYGLARIVTPSDGITHFAYIGGPDVGSLLEANDAISPANSEAREVFNAKVKDIRKMKSARISMRVKTYSPE